MEAASEVRADYEIHFRQSDKKLRMHAAAPMWRNGRRNGLKIRWAEKARAGSSPAIGSSFADLGLISETFRSLNVH
jgi:hypothetical protein